MRVTSAVARKKKKNNLFSKLKGHNQRFQSSYTMGKTLLIKKTRYQFISRKLIKRDRRSLFIVRINAALRKLFDISYSCFMNLMNKSGQIFNRKVLADLCFHDLDSFKILVSPIILSQ